MSKYIIRNCPAHFFDERNGKQKCWQKWGEDNETCQDCTDCLLKQIVEYCLDNEKYGDEYYTRPILKLLDIQEVEQMDGIDDGNGTVIKTGDIK